MLISLHSPITGCCLFFSLKLTLAGQTVEQSWSPDTGAAAALDTNIGFKTRHGYLIRLPNPKSSFQCAIPMAVLWMTMLRYVAVDS